MNVCMATPLGKVVFQTELRKFLVCSSRTSEESLGKDLEEFSSRAKKEVNRRGREGGARRGNSGETCPL